jgi:hypothetical protein
MTLHAMFWIGFGCGVTIVSLPILWAKFVSRRKL